MIDLLDLVRSIAAAAERAAESKNYPVPCGQSSPLLESVRQACVERGYTAGGMAVPGVTVEPAPAGTAVATPQPVIGRLMDQISVLPVLWGLNEPGALLRNSDVLRVLTAAGREQAALAAAPQVVADGRALSLLSGIGCTIIGLHDAVGTTLANAKIAEVKSALAAAPAQVQEPVVELFAEKLAREMREGTAVFVSAEAAPAQPVAVPDGWKLLPVRMTPEMKSILKEVAPKWSAESIYVNLLDAAPAAPAAQGDAKDAERLAIEEKAQEIYSTWQSQPEFVAWKHGGNSHMQERARDMARVAITTKAAS